MFSIMLKPEFKAIKIILEWWNWNECLENNNVDFWPIIPDKKKKNDKNCCAIWKYANDQGYIVI
jgi:hypothetical protein